MHTRFGTMSFAPDFLVESLRVVVRRIRDDDLPALFDVNGDDEVTRFLPYATWRTMADADAWLARMRGLEAKGDCWQFVLVHRAQGRAIGTCLIFHHDAQLRRAELGYVLGRAHWGTGLMQEALRALLPATFSELGLEAMTAELEMANAASSRLLERLGFSRERINRGHWQRDGLPIDSVLYHLPHRDLAAR